MVHSCTRLEYLLQRKKGFRLYGDHKNLMYIMDPSYRPSSLKIFTEEKLQRWALKLFAFNFVIEHITGDDNVWADLLTRWGSSHARRLGSAISNEVLPSVDPACPPASRACGVSTRSRDAHVCPEINGADQPPAEGYRRSPSEPFVGVRPLQQATFIWPDIAEIKDLQQKHDPPDASSVKPICFLDADGLLRFTEPPQRIWIPTECKHLQTRLMVIAHAGSAGHRGIHATHAAIAERFTWNGLHASVNAFCKLCLHCLPTRGGSVVPRPLGSTIQATERNQVLHLDFVHMVALGDTVQALGEFPECLVLKDGLSHYCWPTNPTHALTCTLTLAMPSHPFTSVYE